jgi:hypothetical protein
MRRWLKVVGKGVQLMRAVAGEVKHFDTIAADFDLAGQQLPKLLWLKTMLK